MKYKITIEKVDTQTGIEKEWRKVFDSDAPIMKSAPDTDQYKYIDTPYSREVATKILSQEVDDIDLVEVIKAVNKIQ